MNVRRIAISAALVVLVCTPGFALARGGSNWMGFRGGTSPNRGSSMPMQGMMQAYQTHCQAIATDLEILRTHIQTAQASDDLAHMRAVLDDVQGPLTTMQDHIAKCLQMLRMMPQGHSGKGEPAQHTQTGP